MFLECWTYKDAIILSCYYIQIHTDCLKNRILLYLRTLPSLVTPDFLEQRKWCQIMLAPAMYHRNRKKMLMVIIALWRMCHYSHFTDGKSETHWLFKLQNNVVDTGCEPWMSDSCFILSSLHSLCPRGVGAVWALLYFL